MEGKKLFVDVIKTAENSGSDVIQKYISGVIPPKVTDEGQCALIDLIGSLTPKQLELLERSAKYCVELSFFKLLSILEQGISCYSFSLALEKIDTKDWKVLEKSNIDMSEVLQTWMTTHST